MTVRLSSLSERDNQSDYTAESRDLAQPIRELGSYTELLSHWWAPAGPVSLPIFNSKPIKLEFTESLCSGKAE